MLIYYYSIGSGYYSILSVYVPQLNIDDHFNASHFSSLQETYQEMLLDMSEMW